MGSPKRSIGKIAVKKKDKIPIKFTTLVMNSIFLPLNKLNKK